MLRETPTRHPDPADGYAAQVEFRVLGPLEVLREGEPLRLGGPKQRTVLGLLVAEAGEVVEVDSLLQGVWGEEASPGARSTLHTYVSNLRGALGDDLLSHQGGGYRLRVDRDQVDAFRFEDALARAREAAEDRPAEAARRLGAALALWRGHPYADCRSARLEAEARRLDELRLTATEERLEAELRLGNHGAVVPEAGALAAEHPLRERFRALHMLALYRSGRQAEALRAYQRTRTYLAQELGIEPSVHLRELEARILAQDPALDPPGDPRVEAGVFLFTDIEDSTLRWELDREGMARAVDLHARIITEAVEEAGGRVIKRTGDGMDAIFSEVGEAVAAATAAQRALARADWGEAEALRVRMAIDQGEVEARGEDYFGPTLNRLGRILAVAWGGQVLLSAPAHRALSEGPGGWQVKALGEYRLRGLGRPQAIFQVVAEGLRAEFPPPRVDRTPPRPREGTGRVVRGYELREQVGAGDFGATWRAYQPTVGREVAVKAIHAAYVNRPAFVARFEAAAGAVARLEHPHIVPLYDWWRDPDGAYLVTRWLPSGSLRDALRRGPFHPEEAARVISQISGALAHAHRLGVTHGNLKPSNVLTDAEGNAYLGDFALAPRLTDLSGSSRPQTTTPAYLVPEALGGRPLGPPADLYALGLVAHQVLSGRPPPMDGPLPSLAALRPELPPGLDAVIARATAPDPAERFPSAEAFADALLGALGEPAPAPPPYTPSRNPYKGLQAFAEADAPDFFGRRELVTELLAAVERHRLVAVVGPSGIGKSSVVRAGLLPALRAGGIGGSAEWLITDCYPGSFPFEELEAALLRVAVEHPPGLLGDLGAGPRGLGRVTKRILPPDTELVVVIDQFEELFTLTASEETRRSFLEALLAAVTDARSRVRVVLTLRADFLDRPLRYPGFGEALRRGMVAVTAPGEAELAEAIRRPAQGVGVDFEEGLVDRIVADVADEPGGLPLLQYALTELFAARRADLLTADAYQASGGVVGALGRRAEELYGDLGPSGQEVARQVFLRLVAVGEGPDTRRRVPRRELRALGIASSVLEEVLDRYGEHRLLTFDRDPTTRGPTVEVAHEALLGAWERLGGWVEDRREDLVLHRRLAEAVTEWEEAARDPSYLLQGGRLEHLEAWAEGTDLLLTAGERTYLEASRTAEDHRRQRARKRRRTLTAVLAGAALLATLLAGVALVQRQRAEANEARAAREATRAEREATAAREAEELARSRELAASAIAVLNEDPELSILLALEAVEGGDPPPEAVKALHRAVQASRTIFTARLEESVPVGLSPGAALSPDGLHLAVTGDGRAVELWDVDARTLVGTFGQVGQGPVGSPRGVAFSPDGALVATLDPDAILHVWNVADGSESRYQLPGSGQSGRVDWTPQWITFDSGGRRLAVRTFAEDRSSNVVVWDLDAGSEVRSWTVHEASGGGFHPDGERLVVGDFFASNAVVLDVASGSQTVVVQHDSQVVGAAFSPDGALIATGGIDGHAHLWDAATGDHVLVLKGEQAWVVTFSPDGERLVTSGPDGVARVWEVATGASLMALAGHDAPVRFASFSADGTRLATAGSDLTVRVWDLTTGRAGEVAGFDLGDIHVTALDRSGDRVAVLGRPDGRFSPGPAAVIDLRTGTRFEVPDQVGWGIGLSPDGRGVISQTGSAGPEGRIAGLGPIRMHDVSSGEVTLELQEICAFSTREEAEGCLDAPATPFWEQANGFSFSPDGTVVALAGNSAALSLWDAETGELIAVVPDVVDGNLQSVAFHPDGSVIATSSLRQVVVFELPDLVEVARLDLGQPTGLAFSPDGSLLAVVNGSEEPALVETTTWSVVSRLVGAGSTIDLDFTSDGRLLVTGGREGFIRLWDVETGREVHTVPFELKGVNGVSFLADERHVVIGGVGSVQVMTVDLDELVESARSRVTRSLTDEECQTYLHLETCPET